ncbi:Cys-tRNA(Pro) deacylase [Clostridium cylindrosporum]|uniref:Cys-tRNA(Pro)/Cys-tRNA(Cys) deacylase n=1 Tax=Clostridium cylindrosporum DSM 605 TaxID=1121307 RepID=A0A0J8G392_CLOCY|nr:Cys-tRNA(Pro) deacylase [Clostridium cylindrosporum]KMT22176.1 Cys-tRNA(Pro) deacylase [Clostridium cylindrosporum DSM 605]
MAKIQKTNAMRILDKEKIEYITKVYDTSDGKIDGVSVAKKVGRAENEIFKTIVTIGATKELYVFIIPVDKEIDLKKAAKVAGEKKIDMLPLNDLLKYTGYIRGGCSPIGMKKLYKTFIQENAMNLETMVFSGGKVGLQIELKPDDLKKAISAEFACVIKE